jgi:hypothetical protein
MRTSHSPEVADAGPRLENPLYIYATQLQNKIGTCAEIQSTGYSAKRGTAPQREVMQRRCCCPHN